MKLFSNIKITDTSSIFSIIERILSIITRIIIFAYSDSGSFAIAALFSLWFVFDSIGNHASLQEKQNT